MQTEKFYDFEATNIQGQKVKMSEFEGKAVLVVNTASKCGLTPQFDGLEKLYQQYGKDDFIVLGFPCGQFANQELAKAEEIQEFCKLNYGVSFPMFEKIDVNGKDAHPIFKYLKSKKGGLLGSAIKWNFTKFLIDKKGRVVGRFAPTKTPEEIAGDIEKVI